MLLDLLFPRRCLGCGRSGNYFCAACLNRLLLQPERICPICSQFSPGGLAHPGCRQKNSLDGLTSIFRYEGLIKKAIKKLKYKFITDLAADLTEALVSFCGEDKIFVNACRQAILVPIPLHSSRLRWRGFNQAALLGKMIAQNLDLKFMPDLLIRQKKTTPQFERDKKARYENLKGAFVVNKDSSFMIQDSSFMIFDDIFASGATLNEAAKTLKQAGARQVWGLALAR
ncbi:hypothetical protein COT66_01910 [Candidatus Shapirobacteria bacterium CG09_land_8_20_14_0_10_49_15]|uniref:Double zinc ribbon domain-containing protein n=3 Tax=Candidatus Shapironibacteriota TaxID=1752721 RepID=A0A2M8L6S3_9BACT|nr:MAG: hypothetical protein COT66_01910 [Candidatus Shapirobacteria bacterium CG09_land_8_20_14_0_10_49_15]PJE69926.1 MAG: hypothetical protein COU97_02510 [Candidatus Shapirobacteria bacterium CG10_big_fil_rev_8_21_14_0_10_48_15]